MEGSALLGARQTPSAQLGNQQDAPAGHNNVIAPSEAAKRAVAVIPASRMQPRMRTAISNSSASGGAACNGAAAPGQDAISNVPSSSNAEDSSGGQLSTTAIYKRYQALRRGFAAQQKERAPAIVAANKAKLASWMPQYEALLRSRKSVRLGCGGSLQALSANAPTQDTAMVDVTSDADMEVDSDDGGSGSEDQRLKQQQEWQQQQQQRQQQQEQDQQQEEGSREVPRSLAAGKPTVVTMRQDGRALRVPAKQLPKVLPVPEYVSWEYLNKNELARDIGRRMFYKDDTGETIPASDDDEEGCLIMPWEGKDGPSHDHALTTITAELGAGVLRQLARRLHVTEARLLGRLQQLRVPPKVTEANRLAGAFSSSMAAFSHLFCRRCRTYNCKMHGGGHVKPWIKPAPLPVEESAPPCSTSCWKMRGSLQQQQQPQCPPPAPDSGHSSSSTAAPAMVAAAAAVAAATAACTSAAHAGTARTNGHAIPTATAGTDTPAQPPSKRIKLIHTEANSTVHQPTGLPPLPPVPKPCADASQQHRRQRQQDLQQYQRQQPQGQQQQQRQQQQKQPVPSAAESPQPAQWSEYETGLLQTGLHIFGRNPCKLVLLMPGRSCMDIGEHLETLQLEQPQEPQAPDKAAARKRHQAKGSKSSAKQSAVVSKRLKHSRDEDWPAYEPCACVGPCVAGQCSCIEAGNFCEKFCACNGSDCSARFEGCKCRGGCRTMLCPCLAAGRECDPDLCRSCAATCEGTAQPGGTCCNMGMRLGRQAHISMGLSTVAGWGAFIRCDVRKGDFLGEYTGDVLDQAEANRRGRIYDRIDNSYLFNVNQKYVIDARQRGNTLRFANHSPNPNCHARVLMVDGDHRVAIYAQEDISAGSELFYNYRYDAHNAPDWAKRSGQS